MSNVKICPKCGKENDRYFVICGKCGTSLDGVALVDAETGEKVQEPASAVNGMASAAKNRVAFVLKTMAVITYVCAFICGIAFGSEWGEFYFGTATVDIPNEKTHAAMESSEKGEDLYGPFDSVAELMGGLNA